VLRRANIFLEQLASESNDFFRHRRMVSWRHRALVRRQQLDQWLRHSRNGRAVFKSCTAPRKMFRASNLPCDDELTSSPTLVDEPFKVRFGLGASLRTM
jgi:hypothetical protein